MDSDRDPFLRALPPGPDLPAAVRTLHSRPGIYSGRCSIERGRGLLAALALRVGGFPPAGNDLPVTLSVRRDGDDWLWGRDFAGHQTRSSLGFDPRRAAVREQIGGLTIWMRPTRTGAGLAMDIRRLCLFGVPCPGGLLPRSTAMEWQDDRGRFRFDISARLPGLGLLIRYRGWLVADHGEPGIA